MAGLTWGKNMTEEEQLEWDIDDLIEDIENCEIMAINFEHTCEFILILNDIKPNYTGLEKHQLKTWVDQYLLYGDF